ncbi:hypothetical protein BU26DRAFT_516855, partial [Trematosphaeria pertusa]
MHTNLDPNADFRFQSGAVILDDSSKQVKKSKPARTETGLKCEHPGCKYRGSFNRKYDLQRHMAKHTTTAKFQCPLQQCQYSSYRTDKFLLHFRRAHTDEDEGICPLPGCGTGPLPWPLLKLHTRRHHEIDRGSSNVALEAIWKVPDDVCSCPIESCRGILIKVFYMQEHLRAHPYNERIENRHAILVAGYDATSTNIVCPVCRELLDGTSAFSHHLEESHIATDGTHFRMFCESLQRVGRWSLWSVITSAWVPKPFTVVRSVSCSFCSEDFPEWARVDHHIKLLRDYEPLRPHRLAILKLLPYFGAHPIFDDIRSTVYSCRYR